MPPRYRFMTGAQNYRIEATSLDEALALVLRELNPPPDAEAVIRATIREETPADFLPIPKPLDDEEIED